MRTKKSPGTDGILTLFLNAALGGPNAINSDQLSKRTDALKAIIDKETAKRDRATTLVMAKIYLAENTATPCPVYA